MFDGRFTLFAHSCQPLPEAGDGATLVALGCARARGRDPHVWVSSAQLDPELPIIDEDGPFDLQRLQISSDIQAARRRSYRLSLAFIDFPPFETSSTRLARVLLVWTHMDPPTLG